MRRAPRRERGVVLAAFAAMLTAMLVVGTMGWMLMMQRMQLSQHPKRLDAYVEEVEASLSAYAAANFQALSTPGNSVSAAAVQAGAGITNRWGLTITVSNSLTDNGMPYRVIAAWLPSDTDDSNPPDLNSFASTGVFKSCSNSAAPCAARRVAVVSTLPMQREAEKVTLERLQSIALRAQSYFKMRMLQDPERRVTVNYFRPLSGSCTATYITDRDLQCHNSYESLTSSTRGIKTAALLGLSPEELRDGWGNPMQVRNGPNPPTSGAPIGSTPETQTPPYTMFLRAVPPAGMGAEIRVVAVQPLQ